MLDDYGPVFAVGLLGIITLFVIGLLAVIFNRPVERRPLAWPRAPITPPPMWTVREPRTSYREPTHRVRELLCPHCGHVAGRVREEIEASRETPGDAAGPSSRTEGA